MILYNKLLFIFLLLLLTDTHTEKEVIYSRRDGMALTMFVLTPEKPNGKAIVSLLSGGYYSDYAMYNSYRDRALPFVEAGYTVFLTQHCSTPKYAITDAVEDIQLAVQYVRYNADLYKIDPKKIGITGTSSGGHLALLAATKDDVQNPSSKNPIERVSSKVQAAAVFCPPTDFLSYGKPNYSIRKQMELMRALRVSGSFQYTKFDEEKYNFVVMNEQELIKTDSLMSPAHLVSSDDPPVYISHGTKDDVVPFQQAEVMIAALNKKSIPTKLAVKEGAGHGWKNMNEDEKEFIAWFDKYILK